ACAGVETNAAAHGLLLCREELAAPSRHARVFDAGVAARARARSRASRSRPRGCDRRSVRARTRARLPMGGRGGLELPNLVLVRPGSGAASAGAALRGARYGGDGEPER